METKEIAQQIKLGAFVLVGVALFIVSVFFIGSENNIFTRTFNVSAIFKNVGVKIGTVTNVKIMAEGKVIVTLSLKNNQHEFITRDATASVGSDGLVGNKIVVIRPGSAGEIIAEKDTLNTLSPTDTQELINIAKEVGENTRSVTAGLKLITDKVNSGQGVVGELLSDGQIAQDLRSTVANLKQTSDNTSKATAELSSLLIEMKTGNGLLATLISDTTYANTFSEALRSVKDVSTNADVVSKNLADLAEKMNEQDNAIGVLLQDSTFANDLRNTMTNAEQATRKLDRNMEALQHNFLFKRYFRKQEKQRQRDAASSKGNIMGQ
jgi:phospholipid/cholesterol/gamma-HCH transport system substrate-binding protein